MPAGGIAGEEEMEPQTMAGGGLVAFSGGGNVERYQSAGLTRPQFVQDIMALPQAFDEMKARMREEDARRAEMDRRMAQARADRLAAQQKASFANYLFGSPQREAEGLAELAEMSAAQNLSGTDRRLAANPRSLDVSSPAAAAVAATQTPSPTDPNFRRLPDPRMAGITLPNLRSAAGAPAAPADRSAAPGANPAVPGGGIGDINAMFTRALSAQKYEDPAKEDVAKLGRTMKEGAEGRLSEFDKYIQKTGDVFKGREERLSKREAEISKQKDTNLGLSFLNAGLAIMSTPGGLATAIGKGARVGTEQFASGLEKIRAAKDRLDDARDRVEELKVSRADMTFKDRQALQSEISKAEADALKLGIEGTRLAAGVTEKRAAEVVGNQVRVGIAQFQEAGANTRAAMQERGATARANAPSAQERLALTLGGGNLEKGLTRIAEINAGKFDPKKAYTEYLVAAQKTPGTDLMSYAQFIGQFAIPTSPGNNPAAAPGTVRER
jgi:hypothetical protein